MMRRRGLLLSTVVSLWAALPGQGIANPLDPGQFPVPDNLQANVDFWVDVYSRYTSRQALVHDELYLDVVYEVVDLGDLEGPRISEDRSRRLRRERLRRVRERVVETLRRAAAGGLETAAEQRVARLLDRIPGGREKFLGAARRVRVQTGLRDRFAEAVVASGRYLPGIERLFAAAGVPKELSRLPFVESMFLNHARSKAGASGAWQFMPGTARRYLHMDSAVDGRNDVLLAADGAARMLRHDYEVLGTWPLALTAYNHGRAGMQRAVRQVGSRDLGDIVESYRSRTFGFASRNFYAEFVAAAIVYEDRRRHFPAAVPAPELRFDELRLRDFVSLVDLSAESGVSLERLRKLNPALHPEVFDGALLVPRAYPLRVPRGTLARFEEAYAAIPPTRRRESQLQVGYRVRAGDTLSHLARRFGTSAAAIQRINALPRADRIYVGQHLRIPGQSLGSFATGGALARGGSHVVGPGETLTHIARLYGRSVADLTRANALASAHRIYIGQRLEIPGAATSRHVVRRGDNLSRIARDYGVSVDSLRQANRLASSLIHPGQVLTIP